MGKHEAPPFRMVIERGKLVPATAYDAERLDTYRNGTAVKVRVVEEKDRVLVRKWWAVLNRAVKECQTPWQTSAEASEAIKLALGIVNLSKTVGGQFMAYPKSLTELTDPELQDAVDQMLGILFRITGVDPDDWKKHIADLGEDEPGSGEPPPPQPSEPVTSASGQEPQPLPDGVSNPAEEPVGAGAEGQEQSAPAPAPDEFTAEERKWIRESGRMLWAFAFTAEIDRVQAAAKSIDVPNSIGQRAKDKLRAITKVCIEVADGEPVPKRREIVARHMGVTEDELREVEP